VHKPEHIRPGLPDRSFRPVHHGIRCRFSPQLRPSQPEPTRSKPNCSHNCKFGLPPPSPPEARAQLTHTLPAPAPPSRPPQQARRPRHLRRLSYPCRPRHRLARESKITLSCPLLLLLFALQSISGPVALAVARPTLGRGSSLFALLWGSDSARVSVSSRLRSLG
jgi:hypothetical protein